MHQVLQKTEAAVQLKNTLKARFELTFGSGMYCLNVYICSNGSE
jgi:hypothetical protein